MDINEVYYAIQAVNSDPSLDDERRTIRLQIYQALLYRKKESNNLSMLANELVSDGRQLEKLSNYMFFINEDLEKTRIFVKGYILDSSFISDLRNKGIKDFSFSDIEGYLKQYISATNNTVDDVSLAVSYYPKLLNYKEKYDAMYMKIADYLGEIFGDEMVRDLGNIRGKYQRILERIDRMAVRELFDSRTREWLEGLINELFAYYINDNIKIPIETQIDVSGTKELIA